MNDKNGNKMSPPVKLLTIPDFCPWLEKAASISLPWPIYLINSVDKSKVLCFTSPLTQQHSFFRN